MILQNFFLALCFILTFLWNNEFLSVWLNSLTQICQCQCSVLQPCSSSAPASANTVPNIPFPFDVLVLISHFNKHSVNICMTLWNSREHAPRFLSLASFHRIKSAMQSSSEHFSEGNYCWEKERNSKQIIWILNNLCINIFIRSKCEVRYNYIW